MQHGASEMQEKAGNNSWDYINTNLEQWIHVFQNQLVGQ